MKMTKQELIAEMLTLIRNGTEREFTMAKEVIFGSEHNLREICADAVLLNMNRCTTDYVALIHKLLMKKLHLGGGHVYTHARKAVKRPSLMSDMQRADIM